MSNEFEKKAEVATREFNARYSELLCAQAAVSAAEGGATDEDMAELSNAERAAGGLWRVFCSIDAENAASLQDKILLGVVFHQSDTNPDGHRTLTCHGRRSVYWAMINAIHEKWPEDSGPLGFA